MERDSFIYKMRRTGQRIAHSMLPDEFLSRIYYKIVTGETLDFKNPKTFNEKIQWMKLYYYPNDPLVIQCTDKLLVRDHITEMGLGDKLVPLMGKWERADQIEWNQLPSEFVLKCNHGCAYNIACGDKKKLDKQKTIAQLNRWMKEDFGVFNIELHYSKIKKHMIICEEFLGENITDYKFFCFNGVPKFIYVSKNLIHDRQAQIGFFYLNGKKMPLTRDDYSSIDEIALPDFFGEMLNDAKILCKDFPFVRVDFFLANKRYYFAELTFTPGAGMMPFNPPKYNYKWGDMLDISKIMTDRR